MIPIVLADGGSPTDMFQELMLLVAAATGYIAFRRLRGSGFLTWPVVSGWVALAVTGGAVAAALLLPAILWPPPAAVRPHSTARIEILSPRDGQAFVGDPATVPIRLAVPGGTIVPFTTTRITPTTGHIHLYLDGDLIDMSTTLNDQVTVRPGSHILRAEFVAADHAPFDPRVTATVRFTVRAP